MFSLGLAFYPASGFGVVNPHPLQSKAFLLENPQLCHKLEKAVAEKLAAGDTATDAKSGDVPSDPPSVVASSENAETIPLDLGDGEDEPGSLTADESATPGSGGGDVPRGDGSVTSPPLDVGKEDGEEGVLLEPGVASVEELFERNTFKTETQKEGGGG